MSGVFQSPGELAREKAQSAGRPDDWEEFLSKDENTNQAISQKESQTNISISKHDNMDMKQALGLIGSILLFFGVFAPIVSIPIMGNMNFFQNGRGDGTLILILAIASFVFLFLKKYNWLWFTGIGSLVVMAITFINFQMKISELKRDMESQLAGNPFRGLADMAMQSVQLQWGWAVLVIGAGLVVACAAIKTENSDVC